MRLPFILSKEENILTQAEALGLIDPLRRGHARLCG
jgi:hypothetical protein